MTKMTNLDINNKMFSKTYNVTTNTPKYSIDESEMLLKIISNHKKFDILKKMESKKTSTFSKLEIIHSMTRNIVEMNIFSGGLLNDWNDI